MSPTRSAACGFVLTLAVLLPATRLAAPASAPRASHPAIAPAFVAAGERRFVAPGPHGAAIGVAADRLAVRDGRRFGELRLLGADAGAAAAPEGRLAGRVNVYRGRSARTGLARFARVRYREVWPGIDVVYRGLGDGLEYDFVLAPGADPGRIALRIRGRLPQRAPRAFQTIAGTRVEIPVAFRRDAGGRVRVRLGAHDRGRPLLIDPTVVFATYLGGAGDDRLLGVSSDASGNVIASGITTGTDFPTRAPSQGSSGGGQQDAVVAKFTPAGELVWSTYLGGSGRDQTYDSAAMPDGGAVVGGETDSTNFPVTPGAFQTSLGSIGLGDGFLTRLTPDGAVAWSTYLGGAGQDTVFGLGTGPAGDIAVAGQTVSPNFPVSPGAAQATIGGGQDGFAARFAASGARTWATFLGGSSPDELYDAVVVGDQTWVGGESQSENFPVTPDAAQPATHFSGDAVLARLGADGSLATSTYLGGSGGDVVFGLAADAAGAVYASGYTTSTDFPTAHAAQPASGGQFDGLVMKLGAGGKPAWATYLGGKIDDQASRIAVDAAGVAYVTGNAQSTDLPVTDGSKPSGLGGMLASYEPDGALRRLARVPGVGGTAGVTVDSGGAVTIVGATSSSGFPTTAAFQPARAAGNDGIIERLIPGAPGASSPGADFGALELGAPADRDVTVTNGGTETLVVSAAAVGGGAAADYAITANGCSEAVAPSTSCTVGVRFTPSATGVRAATLDLTTNVAGSPQHVPLTGTGQAPPLALGCSGLSVVLLDLHREGRTVRAGGIALRRYAASVVTVRASRGGASGEAKVRPDGSFAAVLAAPRAKDEPTVRYTATVADKRSPALRPYRRLVITRSRETRTGLRITARVDNAKKGAKVTLRRQVSCGRTQAARTLRVGRGGVVRTTLPRPAAGGELVLYRLGYRASSLPIAVRARG